MNKIFLCTLLLAGILHAETWSTRMYTLTTPPYFQEFHRYRDSSGDPFCGPSRNIHFHDIQNWERTREDPDLLAAYFGKHLPVSFSGEAGIHYEPHPSRIFVHQTDSAHAILERALMTLNATPHNRQLDIRFLAFPHDLIQEQERQAGGSLSATAVWNLWRDGSGRTLHHFVANHENSEGFMAGADMIGSAESGSPFFFLNLNKTWRIQTGGTPFDFKLHGHPALEPDVPTLLAESTCPEGLNRIYLFGTSHMLAPDGRIAERPGQDLPDGRIMRYIPFNRLRLEDALRKHEGRPSLHEEFQNSFTTHPLEFSPDRIQDWLEKQAGILFGESDRIRFFPALGLLELVHNPEEADKSERYLSEIRSGFLQNRSAELRILRFQPQEIAQIQLHPDALPDGAAIWEAWRNGTGTTLAVQRSTLNSWQVSRTHEYPSQWRSDTADPAYGEILYRDTLTTGVSTNIHTQSYQDNPLYKIHIRMAGLQPGPEEDPANPAAALPVIDGFDAIVEIPYGQIAHERPTLILMKTEEKTGDVIAVFFTLKNLMNTRVRPAP